MIEVDGRPIKLEFIRNSHVSLNGCMSEELGLLVLRWEGMFCEKLLANADRFADKSTFSRDIIDLSLMTLNGGPIPTTALENARNVCGEIVDIAFQKAVARIRDPAWLSTCMKELLIHPEFEDRIVSALEDYARTLTSIQAATR